MTHDTTRFPDSSTSVSIAPDSARGGAAPEFDEYAAGYDAGMENPLKRLLGASAEDYIDWKVRWFLRDVQQVRDAADAATNLRVLDCGCGTGTFLRRLRSHGFTGPLFGCDPSERMLEAGARDWRGRRAPEFRQFDGLTLPFPSDTFDAIVVSAVIHHVAPDERAPLLDEVLRVLSPGGRLYIFEHNPWNPVTVWVVRATRIDCHASLASPLALRKVLHRIGFFDVRLRYLMFVPVRWKSLFGLECRALGWIPLGGQYVLVGQKRILSGSPGS